MSEKLTKDQIFEKIKPIIVDKLNINEKYVTMSSSFKDDLSADSLDTVELSLEFEKAFSINIPDTDLEVIRTVQDAVNAIEKHLP